MADVLIREINEYDSHFREMRAVDEINSLAVKRPVKLPQVKKLAFVVRRNGIRRPGLAADRDHGRGRDHALSRLPCEAINSSFIAAGHTENSR